MPSESDMRRRAIRPGELLAIRPDFVKEDRGAFFWLFAPATSQNERFGPVSVVRVNGPLEYHDDGWGESYESIVCRVDKAMSGQDVVDQHRRMHRWDNDFEEATATPPEAVVMRIDSPGGVVAGLDQTIKKLRKMSSDRGIPLYAYVDETAYSAGFALCCACSEIVLPRSGFLGSIGVISTMVDQTAYDKKQGFRFVVLTSGARKADGHPHVPISADMIAEEGPRVTALAKQFYSAVKRARGISVDTIRGWEAKRFLGSEATRAGLADGILTWDEFLSTLTSKFSAQTEEKPTQVAPLGQLVPNSRATEPSMLALDALITRTEAAIKAEKDPAKLAVLAAELESAKKTKKAIKKSEEDEASAADEEDEEASSAKKTGKGDETDRSDDEDDDEDDDEEDDTDTKKGKKSKKSSKKSAAIAPPLAASTDEARVAAVARQLTGKSDPSAVIAALQGLVAGAESMAERMAALETKNRKADRDTKVTEALSARRITPHEAKMLRTKKLAFVEQYIEMRPKGSALVETQALAQFSPGHETPASALAALPDSVRKQLDMAKRHAESMGNKNFDPEKIAADYLQKQHGANGKAEV